jgi:hypothetical protein
LLIIAEIAIVVMFSKSVEVEVVVGYVALSLAVL